MIYGYGRIAIYWTWHEYAILKSKGMNCHGCDNILQKRHDSPLAGHPGQEKTLELIKRDFHWVGMDQFIKYYVSSCQQCSRNKNIHHKKFGLLEPLQIASVVVDRSSKMAIFIPAYGKITALELVQKVFKEELQSEIRRFKKYSDRNRTNPPDFQPGDKVPLASNNIKTTRPTQKLSELWLEPFQVLKNIGSHAYHLKLPQQWKSFHPVFHVSLLEPVKQSTTPNQHQFPPSPVIVEEKEEWDVA
ncbi:hypothetical protein O181_032530 [Austropuccinia psidii MF-1]|uniref:Integrase zinc-binding domain-containing protein n=1 Tax=Austropuccinia psidii MF-1 TaxID=1389203 RepID=A0A9Q3D172_9BASI|nr:hypothetical protein [Austropuccinia psidii MF-1]